MAVARNIQKIINDEPGLYFVIKHDNVRFLEKFMVRNKITYQDLIAVTINHKNKTNPFLEFCCNSGSKKIINSFINKVNINEIIENAPRPIKTIILFMNTLGRYAMLPANIKIQKYVNELDNNGSGLIHSIVCDKDDIGTLAWLLGAGADINLKTHDGNTALYISIINRKIENANFLIENGADLTMTYQNKENILHISCRYGLVEISQVIIEKMLGGVGVMVENSENNANNEKMTTMTTVPTDLINAPDHLGKTPFMKLLASKLFSDLPYVLIDIFLKYTIDINHVNNKGATALIKACKRENIYAVKRLIDVGADVNTGIISKTGYTALHFNAECGNCDIAKILLENGANRNALTKKGRSAICIAAKEDNRTMVKLLAEYDCVFRKKQIRNHKYNKRYSILDNLGPYKNKLHVCYAKCRLMLAAGKFAADSTVHESRFPKEMLREVLQHYIDSIYEDICEMKKMG